MEQPTSTHTMYNDQFELDPIAYGLVDAPQAADAELPPPGFYMAQLTSAGLRLDRETKQPKLDAQGNRVFRINRIQIMDPQEFAGSHAIFQDIYVQGRPQMNWSVTPAVAYTDRPPVYQIVKLLASIDTNLVTGSIEANVDEVERALPSKPVVAVKLVYEGMDMTNVENLVRSGTAKNDAYKASRLYLKHFKNADGTYRPVTEGPSGALVEAKLKIDDFIPSSRVSTLRLGPSKPR